MSRFDYVKYDQTADLQQSAAKYISTSLEIFIEKNLTSPRAKALALTKLEECYAWIGKAIRDDQIMRGAPAPLQEERVNS